MGLTVRLFLSTFPVPHIFCSGIARRKPREVEERFGQEAFLAEGSMFMVLLGVVAAMIVQWLF